MNRHRYETRSKSSSAGARDNQLFPLTSPGHNISARSVCNEATKVQPAADMPTLLTLPIEIVTTILEYAVLESYPIDLRYAGAKPIDNNYHWHIDARVQSQCIARPPVLRVCHYLRDVAGSIFYSGNTFSFSWFPRRNELDAFNALQKLWGKGVEHIRDVMFCNHIIVCHHTRDQGELVVEREQIVLTTKVKLLAGGTLLLARESSSSLTTSNLPLGKVCHCYLEDVAAASDLNSKDNRRVFEIMGHRAFKPRNYYWYKTCGRCSRACLVPGTLEGPSED